MAQIEFLDCPHCGKRVVVSAKVCHHCKGWLRRPAGPDDEESEAHHASNDGGYDTSNEDFDYDEFIAEEFPDRDQGLSFRKRWKYVSILLLIVFAILFLVQLL